MAELEPACGVVAVVCLRRGSLSVWLSTLLYSPSHYCIVWCALKTPLEVGQSSLLLLQPFPSTFLFSTTAVACPHIWNRKFNFFLLAVKTWVDSVHVLHHSSFLSLLTLIQCFQVSLWLLLVPSHWTLSLLPLYHFIIPFRNNYRRKKKSVIQDKI